MCTASYQVQLISAKINLKFLASEAVGASMKKMKEAHLTIASLSLYRCYLITLYIESVLKANVKTYQLLYSGVMTLQCNVWGGRPFCFRGIPTYTPNYWQELRPSFDFIYFGQRFISEFMSDSQPDLFQHCISDLFHMIAQNVWTRMKFSGDSDMNKTHIWFNPEDSWVCTQPINLRILIDLIEVWIIYLIRALWAMVWYNS